MVNLAARLWRFMRHHLGTTTLIYLFNILHIYIHLNKEVHFSTSCVSSVLIMSWASFFVLIVCWKISSVLSLSLTNFSSHAGVQVCRWLLATGSGGRGLVSHTHWLSLCPLQVRRFGAETWSWDVNVSVHDFPVRFDLTWRMLRMDGLWDIGSPSTPLPPSNTNTRTQIHTLIGDNNN